MGVALFYGDKHSTSRYPVRRRSWTTKMASGACIPWRLQDRIILRRAVEDTPVRASQAALAIGLRATYTFHIPLAFHIGHLL
jgi:hypothetical protein